MVGMGKGPRSAPAKLLALPDAYSHDQAAYTPSELARRADLPLATAHRLIGCVASLSIVVPVSDPHRVSWAPAVRVAANGISRQLRAQRTAAAQPAHR